uniref:Uncharacterized protein n=1 Tax=Setaria digitata TaxID=48799 RepID=A0A915PX27_9BILA
MVSRNLHIRAICNDRSVYSCTVSLGSFHGSENTANCKGLMKLYPLDKSCPNLHMRVSMRVYNVDRVNPAIFPRTVLAVDQNTQTEWRTMNRKIQIGVTIRHAAVQLDRLIAEKMIILQKINNAKSANLNSKPKRKIERYCQQYGYNSSSNYQLSKQYDATISAKNSANIRMFNGKSLLRNVKNQNLTQKRNEKINDYCSDNKIAPSTRTLSDDNSDSTSAWNLSEKRRDHMKINANVSDISTGNKTNDKEESTDNENNESTSTAIQITSDDFSSEALTVSELETIK